VVFIESLGRFAIRSQVVSPCLKRGRLQGTESVVNCQVSIFICTSCGSLLLGRCKGDCLTPCSRETDKEWAHISDNGVQVLIIHPICIMSVVDRKGGSVLSRGARFGKRRNIPEYVREYILPPLKKT
jgi:hypothetical protein